MENSEDLPVIRETMLCDVEYKDGRKVINKFITVENELLGEGAFSKVHKIYYKFIWEEEGVEKSETLPYAMKVLNMTALQKKTILNSEFPNMAGFVENELALLKTIRHPHIMKLFEIMTELEDDLEKYYLIMELCGVGSFFSWDNVKSYVIKPSMREFFEQNANLFEMEKLNWDDMKDREALAKFIFKQLFLAVEYLHNKNIMHRDIKWENILGKIVEPYPEDSGEPRKFEVKLIDFSISKKIVKPEDQFGKFVGTPEYRPPEKINELFDGKASDIWALGCCLFSFFFGELPNSDNINLISEETISESLCNLLKGMLEPESEKRLKIDEIQLDEWVLI